MSTMQNKELVRSFVEQVFNKGNIDAVDRFLSPTFVVHFPPSAGVELPPGPAGFGQSVQEQRQAFTDFHVDTESIISEGDTVAARATFSGVHTGSLMGIPPTNKRLSWAIMSFWRIADGKIAEGWVNGDQLGMLQQMGILPERIGMPAGR